MFWNLLFKNKKNEEFIKETIALTLQKAEMDSFNFLQSMQKLDVKEGDIVVLRHPYKLSEQVATNLRTQIKEIIKSSGFNVKVMVLEEGMDIGILTKEIKERMSI